VIRSLADILRLFDRLGQREALRFCQEYRTTVLTYREVLEWVGRACGRLQGLGLGRGSRLVLWGEASPEWVAVFWASIALGIEVVPVDPSFSPEFVQRIQTETGASLLVHDPTRHPLANGIRTLPIRQSVSGAVCRPDLGACRDDGIAEILFTSGTTGSPKGVVHTHRTLAANLDPVAEEILKYRFLARPFQPLRILNLLPLSHLFGQAMGLFIPAILGGSVVFTDSRNPARMVRQVRDNRISVLVAVPRILAQLRTHIDREYKPHLRPPKWSGIAGVVERLWRSRELHRGLGWKFWAIVVGGASLPPDLEQWWSRIGLAVIQGYGLTEAGPIIALNHPFQTRAGSIGKALRGQQIRIDQDGELLVKGQAVSDLRFSRRIEASNLEDGWLRTGDLARLDEQGNLFFLGRKKDVIVTADGLNVFPEEVEALLDRQPEIDDSVVVPEVAAGQETVHAVIIPRRPEGDLGLAVQRVNLQLEAHQRIRGWSVWPESDFPRTSAGLKIKRHVVASWLASQGEAGGRMVTSGRSARLPEGWEGPGVGSVLDRLARRTGGKLTPSVRLDEDLGLTSLDRIQLLDELEEASGRVLDESRFSSLRTVSDLIRFVDDDRSVSGSDSAGGFPPPAYPRWATSFPVRISRWLMLDWAIVPLLRHYLGLRVESEIPPACSPDLPLLFIANHRSHLDTPVILAALPPQWRRRLAPAMAWERFSRVRYSQESTFLERLSSRLQYLAACWIFNAFPLPQTSTAIRSTLSHMGRLVGQGYSLLLFPEGRRSAGAEPGPFRPGAGWIAAGLGLPVLPIYIEGTESVLPPGARRPRKAGVRIRFGTVFEVREAAGAGLAGAEIEKEYLRQFAVRS